MPQIGPAGQQRLLESAVLIVGLGALGSVVADLLARAGVGHLKLLDRDLVELSNLQRQTLFAMPDIGESKSVAAAARLAAVNPSIRLTPLPVELNSRNVLPLAEDVDLIVDATDNAQTRYLLNDASIFTGKPWIYGGAVATRGLVAGFHPARGTACLRCLFPQPPAPGELPTCDTAGVLNTITATIASLQATTALKLLLHPETLPESLFSIDLWTMRWSSIRFDHTRCPACNDRRLDFLHAAPQDVVSLCGRNTVQVLPTQPARLSLANIAQRWGSLGTVETSRYWVRLRPSQTDSTHPVRLATLFADARLLIEFSSLPSDLSVAKGLYDRWVGT